MNDFIHINRVEFLVTKRCNAACMHCSVPINSLSDENSYANMDIVTHSLSWLASNFPIRSVMAYGGEPLLYIEKLIDIFSVANREGIDIIDLITSGFVSMETTDREMANIAEKLVCSGVKRILLSVDAFHQNRIPIGMVESFIKSCKVAGFNNLILHPAWLVSKRDINIYNKKTNEILLYLGKKYALQASSGNIIIPSGSNKKNLRDYYDFHEFELHRKCGEIPYTNALDSISSIRILPDGKVNACRGITIGNIFEKDIGNIIKEYNPTKHGMAASIMCGGVAELLNIAKQLGSSIDINDYYSICDLCTDCINYIKSKERDENGDN